MKHKLKSKGSLIAALDIGSSKVACFIGQVVDEQGGFEIIGVGHQQSKGVKSGGISDLDAAELVIRQAVHAAENMASKVTKGYPLREVIVNLSGVHAKSLSHSAEVSVSGHDITDNDVRRALVHAQESADEAEKELIHSIPVNYHIDGQDQIAEPRGMVGDIMRVDSHLVLGETGALQNMATAIDRSHLDVTGFCHDAYASGLSCLVEDELELGAVVIDIGGGTTSIAVFQNKALVFADAIALGGQHVTSDLAQGLTTGLQDAERLKVLYGSALGGELDDKELIDVPRLGEDIGAAPNHVPRSLLVGIMQPRVEEIFELTRAKLKDSGLANALNRRIVLTGGCAQMSGISDIAQHVLDKQVRIGRPLHMRGLPDAVSGPSFATAAGLLKYIAERSDEMPSDILAQVEPGTLWERVTFWLKENW